MSRQILERISIWARRACSQHNLKKALRAAITLAIMLICVVSPQAAQSIGQFNVFGAALAMAFPCFLPFSIHLVVMTTLLLMLLVSWAWICVATATGYAVRNKSFLASQLQAASTLTGDSSTAATAALVMSGQFLETGCSVVFGLFLLIGAFALGLGIAYKPQFILQFFFALALISIMFFTNPLLPVPIYDGSASVLKAIAVYAVVSSATYIFVFPESFSHAWMKKAQQDIFLPIIASLGRNTSFQRDEVIGQLDEMLDLYRTEKSLFAFEFSVARLSPQEFNDLFEQVHRIVLKVKYLYFSQGPTCRVDVANELKYDESLRTLQDFADDVQNYSRFSLISIHGWFYASTKYSWRNVFKGPDHDKVAFGLQGLETAHHNLTNARKAFLSHAGQFHDAAQNLTPAGGLTAIFSSLDNLDLLAADIISLLDFLIAVERRSPPFRFWSPAVPVSFRRRSCTRPVAEGKPPSLSSFSILGDATAWKSRLVDWMADPRTIMAFRIALVSVGVFVLGVCKSTINLYAQYGGITAMVLAQSYITIYAGDQIRFWVIRMSATLFGLLVTPVAWAISAGDGNGNPYAFVIATTCICLPAVLLTVSSWKVTHMLFGILFATTLVSTMTTVWIKAQEDTVSRTDVFTIVGERAGADVFAFAVSVLAMLLPMGPITARRGFHDLLAASVEVAHAEVVRSTANATKSEASIKASSNSSKVHSIVPLEDVRTGTKTSGAASSVSLANHQLMRGLLMSMTFEPRVSALPRTTYVQIFEAHARLLASSALYSGALQRLNIHPQQQKHLESRIPGLNASMVDKVLHGIEHLMVSTRRRYHDVEPDFLPPMAQVRPGLVRSPRILVRLKRLYSVLDRTDPWKHTEEGVTPHADAMYNSATMPTLQDHIEFFHSYAQLQLGMVGLGIKYAPLGSGDVLALATVVWHFSSIVKEVDTMNRLLESME